MTRLGDPIFGLRRLLISSVLALAILVSARPPARAAETPDQDVLDTPAMFVSGAQRPEAQPLIAATTAGKRLIAVGLRGLIAYSDNGGTIWHQASVPVQDDLVAVQFIDPQTGWAVGHDGVILKSTDGGVTWIRQLDARDAAAGFVDYYAKQIAKNPNVQGYLDEVKLNMVGTVSLPYLGVYFLDARHGYAVGSFGTIAATVDGGATWFPALQDIDNPQYLNLNAIKEVGGVLYIVGEMGTIFRYDPDQRRFIAISTDYKGSFFDVTGGPDFVLAVGLRGTAYRSDDHGKTWRKVATGSTESIVAATVLADGKTVVFVTSNGVALVSHDGGLTFKPSRLPAMTLYAGVATIGSNAIATVGYQGIRTQSLAGTN